MIADYLGAEPALLARVSAIPGIHSVLSAADLSDLAETAQRTPAVHVLYMGDEVNEGRLAQVVKQRWMIVLAVRHARDKSGSHARETAGPLLSALLDSLQGWRPTEWHEAMVRINAPEPAYTPGYAYFPLQFEALMTTKGASL